MQAMSGGPSTPIEQVTELGEAIIQKLVAHGITTVEALADMTPEELEEVPGIGEKLWRRSASPSAITSANTKRAKRGQLQQKWLQLRSKTKPSPACLRKMSRLPRKMARAW